MPDQITVSEFVAETNEDYKSPTASNFTTRMSHCRNTVTALEEVSDFGHNSENCPPIIQTQCGIFLKNFSCKDSCQLRVRQCAKMLLCTQPLPHPSFSHVPAPTSSAIVHQGIYYSPGSISRYCTVVFGAIYQLADIVVVSDTLADMKTLHFLNIIMQENTFNTPFYN